LQIPENYAIVRIKKIFYLIFCQPIFLVGYEEAVDWDREGEDAEPDHEGGVDVEPHRPEVKLQQTVIISKGGT